VLLRIGMTPRTRTLLSIGAVMVLAVAAVLLFVHHRKSGSPAAAVPGSDVAGAAPDTAVFVDHAGVRTNLPVKAPIAFDKPVVTAAATMMPATSALVPLDAAIAPNALLHRSHPVDRVTYSAGSSAPIGALMPVLAMPAPMAKAADPDAGLPDMPNPFVEPTPAAPASFCPVGEIEKGDKAEHWCTRGDKGGISFREGPYVALYSSGKPKVDGHYKEGRPDGHWVEYFPNGKKSEEGEYRNGRKTGSWTTWWESGVKSSVGEWSGGVKQGHWVLYGENGKKQAEGDYRTEEKLAKEVGHWTFWYPEGLKKSEGSFRDGRRDGRWTEWDGKGRILSVEDYRDGYKETM
jgi:antitoxin component YwqK of YwqJK toxin-antitoxin module